MQPELLPKFIEENLEEFDASFYEYLQKKIDHSTDIEERVTLNTLKDAITDLMNQLLRKHGPEKSANTKEPEVVSEAETQFRHQEMYRNLIRHANDAQRLQVAVSANYDRFTADFLNFVFEKAHAAQDSGGAAVKVSQAINDEMKSRMEKAAQKLTEVLRGGSPNQMTKKMREFGSAGGIDEAFILLLQANTERAKKEGANAEVLQILEQLREQASRIIDEAVKDKELRLVRALLRTEDPEKRRQMLFAAFSPKDHVFLPNDAEPDAQMEIDGKRFLQILRELIEKYGAIDEKLVSRCREIGDQADEVARELLELIGKGPQELQNEAWMRTVSVFELERMEIQAEMEGRKMPWQERPPGFDEDGRRHL
jgi:cell division septum initiation protein DivIVA